MGTNPHRSVGAMLVAYRASFDQHATEVAREADGRTRDRGRGCDCGGGRQRTSQGSDLTLVQDSQGRFLISVPPTWLVDWSPRDPVLSAKSPEAPGTSLDTLDVFVRDTAFALSPEGCATQVAWAMRITIHSWTTLSEGPDTVGGLAAYSRTYTWRLLTTGEERRSIQTCVPMGRRVFVIIGTTMNTPIRVARNLSDLARMIATFRLGSAPLPAAPVPQGGNER